MIRFLYHCLIKSGNLLGILHIFLVCIDRSRQIFPLGVQRRYGGRQMFLDAGFQLFQGGNPVRSMVYTSPAGFSDPDEVAVSEEGSAVPADGSVVEASVLDTADGISVFGGVLWAASRQGQQHDHGQKPANRFFIFKSSHFFLNPHRLSREGYGYIGLGGQSYIE